MPRVLQDRNGKRCPAATQPQLGRDPAAAQLTVPSMLPLTRRSSEIWARLVTFCVCLYSRTAGLLSRGG